MLMFAQRSQVRMHGEFSVADVLRLVALAFFIFMYLYKFLIELHRIWLCIMIEYFILQEGVNFTHSFL